MARMPELERAWHNALWRNGLQINGGPGRRVPHLPGSGQPFARPGHILRHSGSNRRCRQEHNAFSRRCRMYVVGAAEKVRPQWGPASVRAARMRRTSSAVGQRAFDFMSRANAAAAASGGTIAAQRWSAYAVRCRTMRVGSRSRGRTAGMISACIRSSARSKSNRLSTDHRRTFLFLSRSPFISN